MLNFKYIKLIFLIPLALINYPITADDLLIEEPLIPFNEIEEPTFDAQVEPALDERPVVVQKEDQPRILAKFYSADAIQAIPRLKPLAKQDSEHNKIIFKLEGFPKHKEILFEINRLSTKNPNNYEQKFSFTIEDDGSMLISNSDQHLNAIIFSSRGYLPGERVYFRFRTVDGAVSKVISGVPTPATVKDKDHRVVLRAHLVSVNPTAYQIIIPPMDDGEEYQLKSTCLGDTTKAKPKYSKKKPLVYTPTGRSKGGEAVLEIRRKTGQVYAIRLPWGSTLECYSHGKKVYSPTP